VTDPSILSDRELNALAGSSDDDVAVLCVIRELRARRALDEHRRRSDEELIARRSRDLSAEDLEALRWAHEVMANCTILVPEHKRLAAAAVLDRLTSEKGEK
jgi:hypothetical protein